MKLNFTYPILVLTAFLFFSREAFSQFNVQITVNSGASTTTCTDLFSAPDPLWGINIENAGWMYYPKQGTCFTALPNVQFNQTYTCFAAVPATIQVCYRAFENDPNILIACDIVTSCLAETCINVPVPPQGSQSFTIPLPPGMPSGGSANLTIKSSGFPGGYNDLPCDAINFGTLLNNNTYGNADTSFFNNYCATNVNEPEPSNWGTGWINTRAVWFKFTTNNNPGPYIQVLAKSDPSNFGDSLNLQVAIFKTDDNACTGNYTLVTQNHNPVDWDENVLLVCPPANTTYYVMVDVVSDTPEMIEGYFGFEVNTLDVQRGGDLRCQAESLGAVPLGGSVNSGWRTNSCATSTDDPVVTAFALQKTVWFSFNPPPTGHVLINAVSDTDYDPIGLQLAVFTSSDNTCTGTYSLLKTAFTPVDLNETIELHCQDPNQTLFVLVDGSSANLIPGIFMLTVSDAGDETAMTTIDTALCSGGSITVGTSVYTQVGTYQDTFQLLTGCDSIVITNVSLLTPVEVNLSIVQQGLGQGNTNGAALASPSGGAGGYSYLWSNGQTNAQGNNLVGGNIECVTVTDQNNCTADTCFEMPYYLHFIPSVQMDSVACNGGTDGRLHLTASFGLPPYQFTWQNANNSLNGSGSILADGQIITIKNLPAGQYSFHIVDFYFDTTVVAEVLQPAQVGIANATITDAACFSECNGSIQVEANGGTPPYQFVWSNGKNGFFTGGLCAGSYTVTVTDSKGCTGEFDYTVSQPAQFIATVSEVQTVSCFQGKDGEASVSTNGTPAIWLWSNNETTPAISGLSGGIYSVTVTNSDGCTATASVTINTPAAPVGVSISMQDAIVCKGEKNGSIMANVTGPGTNFNYLWSTGEITPAASKLGTGNYSVTVSNEKGCSATATYFLNEPPQITAVFSGNQLTCFDEPDGGIITIESVSGGVSPYTFSTNGQAFNPEKILEGYTAGDQVFYVKDASGCVKPFTATIEGPKELFIEAGENQTIDLGDFADLDAIANLPDVTFQWEPAEWLDCPDCAYTTAQPIETTTFRLVVTDTWGCTKTDALTIEVVKKRKVFVPNAFSPNGDGFNDEFVPFGGNDVVLIKSFKIFDRQGNMVFATNNFMPGDVNNAWNGTFKGKTMQPAVLVWFAEVEFLDKEVQIFRGDVMLMR